MNTNELKIGDKAPFFKGIDQSDTEISLNNFLGKWLVLYFYPKDNTSGCTKEAIGFSNAIDEFNKFNANIIGVSPDSVKSHINFINKHNLKVQLISDEEKEILTAYNVWKLKKLYGREYMGVVRTTYLINPKGEIAFIWNNVKVKNHIEKVLEKLKELHN